MVWFWDCTVPTKVCGLEYLYGLVLRLYCTVPAKVCGLEDLYGLVLGLGLIEQLLQGVLNQPLLS